MVLYDPVTDDYHPTEGYYGCCSCRARIVSTGHLSECPDCGGLVRNIAVAHEWGASRAIPHVIDSDD